MSRIHALLSLPLVSLIACVPSSSPNGSAAVGSVRASIAVVPSGVSCLRITATAAATVVYDFDVMPGQGSVVTMQNVPVGNVTFAAFAFASACASVGSSQPTWASQATTAAIMPGQTTPLGLTLSQVGSATATINFDTDAGVPGPDLSVVDLARPVDLATVDLAPACAHAGGACTSSSQCCSGECLFGTCIGG
jgi:hypothetical protein